MTHHITTSKGQFVSRIVTDLVGRVVDVETGRGTLTFDTPADAQFESDWVNRFDWKTSVVSVA